MNSLYQNFDFKQLYSPDFKEDSVREVLILPILDKLGYNNTQIVRSKSLKHPFVNIGSKKRAISIVPDYLFKVEDSFAWVLDAKAPHENIKNGENLEQIYSYAIHPEVRTKFFALCNGNEFILFRQDQEQPLLYFGLPEIDSHWDELLGYLSPNSFQSGKTFTYSVAKKVNTKDFDYLTRPLLEELPVQKQSAKRHFGVHGYFTKQSWNIVHEYIRNFTKVGDVVLDPFGGSGVTAIEALMTERKGIHIDLNPMSVFMVDSLLAPVNISKLTEAFDRVKSEYVKKAPITKEQIEKALIKYPYPKNIKLPKGSDVETVDQLFSSKQLAQLSFLKYLISKETDENIRKTLMLMFSGLLTKANLTYHTTPTKPAEGQGDASVFRYYRYRIAPEPVTIDLMKYFKLRLDKIVAAKNEIQAISKDTILKNTQILKGTATNLSFLKKESVDYIYTDPPYGKKIPYLDLSAMWNAWLDLKVSEQDFNMEAIEGGDHKKSKESYNELIAKSIEEMYRVLKYDRWMSFVFAHKDPEFWHLIIDTAERCGFEYAGAVPQKNGQSSFKKRQNPFTVLSGQLIINFKKVRRPKYIMKASLGMGISDIVIQTVEGVIAKYNGATLEQINDELIVKGLELGFLDLLKKEYSDLTPFLLDTFDYIDNEFFAIKKDTKFKTHIDLNLRVRYYLISYLTRQGIEKKVPTLENICYHIIPLLKNGTTPEQQTVLNVLEDIAVRVGENGWQLRKIGQQRLFH